MSTMEAGLKRRAEDDGRPRTADATSHHSPSIASAVSTSIRQSPSMRGADLTPSRLAPNSNPRSSGVAGRNSPNYAAPGTSLPSFENLSSTLPEDDTKRRRMSYSNQEPEMDPRYSHDRDGRNGNPNRIGSAGLGQAPPLPETRRPSDTDFDGSASNLARRRGDAAQAKVSRMTIDTGSATSTTSFDQGIHSGNARLWDSRPSGDIQPAAKSAPPTKISFEDREHYQSQPSLPTHREIEPARHASFSAAQANTNHNGHSRDPNASSLNPLRSNSTQEGARNQQGGAREGGNLGRGVRVGLEDPSNLATNSPPTVTRNLAPESASQGSSRQVPGSARFAPQTATLPSPAYHTTSFMRQQHAGAVGGGPPQATPSAAYPPRTAMPNPPPTARLPEHLRSPPSSKTQFLSLFASFYDSLGDSRTLKATLEDQVRRSNSLLQTLQRSSRVLEETVERKVRDERLIWAERTRKLEQRVKELEEKVGLQGPPSRDDKGIGGSTGTDGASSNSLESGANPAQAAAAAAASTSSDQTATSTSTTPSKRGARNNAGKASSSTSTSNKGKGKATKTTTRSRTRRSSASTSGGVEADEEKQEVGVGQEAENNSKDDSETNGNQKKSEEEKDELMEE